MDEKNIFQYVDNFAMHFQVRSVLMHGDYSKVAQPLISVIMPIYKRPEMLRKALESVVAQTFTLPYEIVIVDNSEEEGYKNLSVIQSFKQNNIFYYLHDKNIGMYGNINRGISLSRAKYVTFCHDDDTLTKNCLDVLFHYKNMLGKECIIGEHNIMDEDNNITRVPDYPQKRLGILNLKGYYRYTMFDMMVIRPGIGCGGDLFDRSVLMELGGFNESLFPGNDYALLLNYAKSYGAIQLSTSTYNYRIAQNTSFEVANQFAAITQLCHSNIKKYIPLPNFLLEILARMIKMDINMGCKRMWGMEYQEKKHFLYLVSSFILRVLHIFIKLKAYRFFIVNRKR